MYALHILFVIMCLHNIQFHCDYEMGTDDEKEDDKKSFKVKSNLEKRYRERDIEWGQSECQKERDRETERQR